MLYPGHLRAFCHIIGHIKCYTFSLDVAAFWLQPVMRTFEVSPKWHDSVIINEVVSGGDIKISHGRMTKTCWETFVTCL